MFLTTTSIVVRQVLLPLVALSYYQLKKFCCNFRQIIHTDWDTPARFLSNCYPNHHEDIIVSPFFWSKVHESSKLCRNFVTDNMICWWGRRILLWALFWAMCMNWTNNLLKKCLPTSLKCEKLYNSLSTLSLNYINLLEKMSPIQHACSPFIMFYFIFRIGIQHVSIFIIINPYIDY